MQNALVPPSQPNAALNGNSRLRNAPSTYSRASSPSGSSNYRTPAETAENGDDDDIPLASRIPTALTAQKSIRLKARASARRPQKLKSASIPVPSQADRRTGKEASPTSPGLPAEELMRKLMELQVKDDRKVPVNDKPALTTKSARQQQPGSSWTSVVLPSPASPTSRIPHSAPAVRKTTGGQANAVTSPLSPSFPVRAPVQATGPVAVSSHRAPPVTFSQPVTRSGTLHRPRNRLSDPSDRERSEATMLANSVQSHSRSNNRREPSATHSREPLEISTNTSTSDAARSQPRHQDPPQLEILFTVDVYLFDMQRAIKLDIDASTTAKSALDSIVKRRGAIGGDIARLSELTLWEIANDFGMERPIREFESLRRVCDVWDIQKPVNAFMVKYCALSSLLTSKAVPSVPPTAQSDVQWQAKRGKWSKRHLHLHDGNFYLSKVGKGKDEPFLCSVTNHDFYLITRIHKAPKPFIFAIKSTDNIVFYENPEESLHVFAVGQTEGERWMEQVLLARSTILLRDQQPSYTPGSANGMLGAEAQMVARARTVRQAAVPSVPVTTRTGNPFQAGTLLGRLARKI